MIITEETKLKLMCEEVKTIKEGEEITLNYKNAPDYIDKNTEGYK